MKNGLSRQKIVIICICVCAFLLLLSVGAYAYFNFNTTYVFLGKPVTEEAYANVEQFIEDCVKEYYPDKKVTLTRGDFKKEVSATELQSVNIGKTAEIFNAYKNENLLFKMKNKEILPAIDLNDDEIKGFIKSFIDENKIDDFYTVSQDLKTVDVDFSKTVPDILETYYEISKKLNNVDFSKTNLKLLDKGTMEDAQFLYDMICKPAVDATMDFESENQEITPEQNGYKVDIEQLKENIQKGNTKFSLDITEIIEPEITAKFLEEKVMFGDVLATLTSRYNPGVVGRSKNISIAAQKINGTILKPGEVFSYNSVVGPRTYQNGFKDAGVYTATGVENGVGGGICQVSSTLYGAQLMADLKTVTRTNHSYTISYLPSGQDATVSYGAIDYKFSNNKRFPIKIECYASGGVLTVNILGIKDKDYHEIKISNKIIETTSPDVIQKEVDTLQDGQQKVVQSGQNGLTVETYKNYYKNGQFVKSEFVHKSVYIPMPKIIEVGKKITAQLPQEEPSSDEKTDEPETKIDEEPLPTESTEDATKEDVEESVEEDVEENEKNENNISESSPNNIENEE